MKKDELNNIKHRNGDGEFRVEENSLRNIKEVNSVPEIKKPAKEVFETSEDNKPKEEEKK